MNSLNIIGRLSRDPELKYTGKGTAVVNFSLAFDIGWGEQKKAAFLDCAVFGKAAENLQKLVTKGQRVALSGSLDHQEWTGKDGNKKSMFTMKVQDFTLLEKSQGGAAPRQDRPSTSRQAADAALDGTDQDDIPF